MSVVKSIDLCSIRILLLCFCQGLFDLFGIHQFMPQSPLYKLLGVTVCADPVTRVLCENILFLFAGYDSVQLNAVGKHTVTVLKYFSCYSYTTWRLTLSRILLRFHSLTRLSHLD